MSKFQGHYRSGNSEVHHLRCVGLIAKHYCVLHIRSAKLRERGPPPENTLQVKLHTQWTHCCYNILLYQWDLQSFNGNIS